MAEFEVTLREIEVYMLTITAENEEQAEMKAWEIFDRMDLKDKGIVHHDSETEVEVTELSE